jgi:hypothetical protein
VALALGVVVVVALVVTLLGTSRSPSTPASVGAAAATSPGASNASPGASPNTSPRAVPSAGSSASGAPAGYQTFSDQADHFSIAVPSEWRSVDPTSPGAAAAFEQIQAANPNFKRGFNGNLSSLLANDVKFLAVAPPSQAAEAANLNVIVKPAPGFVDADLGQIRNALPGEYTKIGATLLGITTITLDGHQALKTTAHLPVNTDLGNTLLASQSQYVLGANDFIYIITMTGTSPDLSTIAATFQTN